MCQTSESGHDQGQSCGKLARCLPNAVVVLTDGYAGRPNIRTPCDWLWLLTDVGTDAAIDGLGRIIRVRLR
jgi:hypothetical protein